MMYIYLFGFLAPASIVYDESPFGRNAEVTARRDRGGKVPVIETRVIPAIYSLLKV